MRVVTLLPAATEIVAALGGAAWLVGVSHECDYPPEVVRSLPRVTRTTIDTSLPSAAIDRQAAATRTAGTSPITVDADALARLAPDVIISQAVCDVCAVGDAELARALEGVTARPRVVTLHAHRLEEVFADIVRVAEALDLADESTELVMGLRYRLRRVRPSHSPLTTPLRTVVLEWLDPPYVAGHWVPELVALAGGIDVGGRPGARSTARPWRELAALAPDLIVIALCGFDVPRATRELATVTDPDARALLGKRVELIDGNAYTSRPGPRLVDAADQLSRLMRG